MAWTSGLMAFATAAMLLACGAEGRMTMTAEEPAAATTEKPWTELAGDNHWSGLLDPLDFDLRKTILSYGDLAEVTYDNFKIQHDLPYEGTTLFDLGSLFQDCGLVGREKGPYAYTATKYIYATSAVVVPGCFAVPMQSNWMGFVAVATDEGAQRLGRRDIVVAWRGTRQAVEWVKDFDWAPTPATVLVGGGLTAPMVHHGFLSIYTTANPSSENNKQSARDQVSDEIRRLLDQYKNETISITVVGHSLGAALTTLSAWDIAQSGLAGNISVTGYAFASPLVGNPSFQSAFSSIPNLRLLRITNRMDVVPQLPPPFLGFAKVGEMLQIDTSKSPYLVQPGDLDTWHDLECYQHVIAGTQGSNGGFNLVVQRDISLVNKFSNALLPKFGVAPFWWITKYGGAMP